MPRNTERLPEKLDSTLQALLLEGVRKARSYDPEKVFDKIKAMLTYGESKMTRPFLEWVRETGYGFSCNPSIREAWERYRESVEPEPSPEPRGANSCAPYPGDDRVQEILRAWGMEMGIRNEETTSRVE